MNKNNLFTTKGPFDDLEINSLDKVKIYCSKGWLYHVSPYFQALLTSGFSESKDSVITLSYKSKIIIILLECMYETVNREDYSKKILLDKITKKEDLCELLHLCNEYQLFSVKKIIDIIFSESTVINKFFSTELITTIHLLELPQMKEAINKYTRRNIKIFDSLDFTIMSHKTLSFFTRWDELIYCFKKWAAINEVTDEILEQAAIFDTDFADMSPEYAPQLMLIIRKCDKAPVYQLRVLKLLSRVLYPD